MCAEDRHEKLQAYIVVGCNRDSGNFVACNFSPGEQKKMSELLFLFFTGSLFEECTKSLASACETEDEATEILNKASMMIKYQQMNKQMDAPSGPVVDPCEVFRGSDNREYKG